MRTRLHALGKEVVSQPIYVWEPGKPSELFQSPRSLLDERLMLDNPQVRCGTQETFDDLTYQLTHYRVYAQRKDLDVSARSATTAHWSKRSDFCFELVSGCVTEVGLGGRIAQNVTVVAPMYPHQCPPAVSPESPSKKRYCIDALGTRIHSPLISICTPAEVTR
jgi:hypothetical protein